MESQMPPTPVCSQRLLRMIASSHRGLRTPASSHRLLPMPVGAWAASTRKSPVVRCMACPLSTVTRLAPVRHVRVVANAVDRMEAVASAVAIMCARIVPQRALRRAICNVYHARPSLPHMDRRRSKLASMGQGRDSQHRMGSITTTHAPGYPVRAQEAPAHQVPLGACESLRGPLPLQLGQ